MARKAMETVVIAVDPERPDRRVMAMAAERLWAGQLVAFPTETVYGLGADALNSDAVARIFAAKGRPAGNPVIVHTADVQAAMAMAEHWPEEATLLAARLWPGPLSLVVRRNAQVPDIVTAGGPTVALRVPAHPVALALLRAFGRPIAAPSANRSTSLSPTTADHVLASLRGRVPIVLDGGPTTGGLESTVIDVTESPARLLRPGLISPAQIEAVIGPIARDTGFATGAARSPGMMARHYAPRATLAFGQWTDAVTLAAQGHKVGWLGFEERAAPPAHITALVMPLDPDGYARVLYAALHTLDADGVERTVVERPPETEEWLAVRDRLHRASQPIDFSDIDFSDKEK